MAWLPSLPSLGQDVAPTDDATAQLMLKRKLAMVDALKNQEAPQGQMVSGHYVAPSWTQYLGNLANKWVAGDQEREAMKSYQDYDTNKQQKYIDILRGKPTLENSNFQIQKPTMNWQQEGSENAPTQSVNVPVTNTTGYTPYNTQELIAQMSKIDPHMANELLKAKITSGIKAGEPFNLGANEARYQGVDANGKPIQIAANIVDKPELTTTLAKLTKERDAIKLANPNDLRLPSYEDAIKKETTFAPPAINNSVVNMPKVETSARIESNQDFTKNVYRPTLDSAARNSIVLSRLDALESLPINEKTGWGTQAQAKAAEILVGLGYKNEDAQKLASNAQTFRAIQSRQINDELNMAKGPQTEGDAQRAAATVASLGNTPDANKFTTDLQRAIIKRKNAEAKFYRTHYASALNAGDLSQMERDWMDSPEAAKSIFDYPEMQKWNKNANPNAAPAQKRMRWNPATNQLEPM